MRVQRRERCFESNERLAFVGNKTRTRRCRGPILDQRRWMTLFDTARKQETPKNRPMIRVTVRREVQHHVSRDPEDWPEPM